MVANMKKMKFIKFSVKRFRSLKDVTIDVSDEGPVVICGENNIGKTNFLRALNIFFNHKEGDLFNAEEDIPHHIYEGSRGGNTNTEMTGYFSDGHKNFTVKTVFHQDGIFENFLDNKNSDSSNVSVKIENILLSFKYLFIESHNVDLPSLIAIALEKEGLLALDKKRSKQSKPLKKLEEFIKLSGNAIADIEKDINNCFLKLTDFDGILKDKQIKINFAEFDFLREAVIGMTSITLFDGNNYGIGTKGSGAQRAVFLSLMQYISKNSKKNVIWGVDEPEAFLQPKLQKKVADVFREITSTENQPIILTTHSPHFINLQDLSCVHLFIGRQEEKRYARKPGQVYYEMNAGPVETSSNQEKALQIKEHLGIAGNDGWEVLPYNVVVEGEEDKKFLETLMTKANISIPNIIWSGGATKIGGYLQYYNIFAKELSFKPKFICVFDNDKEGKEQSSKINPSKLQYISASIEPLPRFDGKINDGTMKNNNDESWEIEDFVPPKLIVDAINSILKKSSYSIITKDQLSNRSKSANIKKQILLYAEECIGHRNPDKEPFVLDGNSGRKKQVCIKACELLNDKPEDYELDAKQIKFLKKIVN